MFEAHDREYITSARDRTVQKPLKTGGNIYYYVSLFLFAADIIIVITICVEKLGHKTCCHTHVVVFEKFEYNIHHLAQYYYVM